MTSCPLVGRCPHGIGVVGAQRCREWPVHFSALRSGADGASNP
jgi:hypothetical protein